MRNDYNLLKSIQREGNRATIHHYYHKKDEGEYEAIFPDGTYAPWKNDKSFQALFKHIKDNTLLDLYRLWQLYYQLQQVKDIEGAIVEIGSWRGGSGFLLAAAGHNKTVYLCDTFTGVVKANDTYDPRYRGGEHSDTSLETVEALFHSAGTDFNLSEYHILQGIFPDDTGGKLAAEKIALVHIDVDVYQSAKDSLSFLWPKMPSGALVVFDDYGFQACAGVRHFVTEVETWPDARVVPLLSGQAIVVKL